MELYQSRNNLVLASLSRRGPGKALIEPPDATPEIDAYLHSGCHPDVVERLWDQINPVLPSDCRYLIYGTPGLVHPGGLILAVGIGTTYGCRTLPSQVKEVVQAGAKTINVGIGGGMDIQQAYGPDWIFGTWRSQELKWCQAVYAAASDAEPLLMDGSIRVPAEEKDYAAIAEKERRTYQAALEERAATGDIDAKFALFEVVMNAAFRQRSLTLLDRADSLLTQAVTGGHVKAVAMAVAWPWLRTEGQRQFVGASSDRHGFPSRRNG